MPGFNFRSFRSTFTQLVPRSWTQPVRLLVDAVTGAPAGIENWNANGPDGMFVPIDLTAAQIASPTAAMLADINATYRLNVAPYTRYQSDGTGLQPLAAASTDGSNFPGSVTQTLREGDPLQIIGADSYAVVYEPFTVESEAGIEVRGELRVIERPA